MSKAKDYRSANLAKHCGNCVFHLWEEDKAVCQNPAFLAVEDAARTAVGMGWHEEDMRAKAADYVLEDFFTDSDWQEYHAICDDWAGKSEHLVMSHSLELWEESFYEALDVEAARPDPTEVIREPCDDPDCQACKVATVLHTPQTAEAEQCCDPGCHACKAEHEARLLKQQLSDVNKKGYEEGRAAVIAELRELYHHWALVAEGAPHKEYIAAHQYIKDVKQITGDS